jgi:hypothetical protein
MEHLQEVYSIILIATGILSILLSFYVLINSKGGQGTKPFFWVIFTSVIYSFGYAFELTSTTLDEINFWLKIEYLGAPFIPVFILIMCI